VTLARTGPLWHHFIISSTFSLGPSNTASTFPSGVFLTHPFIPSSSALSFVLALNQTPCTLPDINT